MLYKRISAIAVCLLLSFVLSLGSLASTPWVYVDAVYDYEDASDYNGAVPSLNKVMDNASYFTDPNVTMAAEAKLKHYGNAIELYSETEKSQSFTGALHEHAIGVKMATCSVKGFPFDSCILTYMLDESLFAKARNDGKDLLFAFNVNGEGSTVRYGDFSRDAYRLVELCNKYSDLRVFVRFGAEMNCWTDMCTPDEYVSAYRKVASIVKQNTTNAAMVWGINYVSHAGVDYMDYYPGDEYVDWIGTCFYADMYQDGTTYSGDSAFLNRICDTMYFKGLAADPVIVIRELSSKFGGRKPVMITECGASTRVNYGNMSGEDTTEFASSALRKIYEYVAMCCPEVKLIASFNTSIPGEVGSYRIEGVEPLESLYTSFSNKGHIINPTLDRAPIAYEKIDDGFVTYTDKLNISSYIKNFAVYEPTVEYYLDGAKIATCNEIPYRTTLDLSGYANGEHSIRVVSLDAGKVIQEKTFRFTLAVPSVGDKINDVLSTDIVAKIAGLPIKSYNIDGNTAVVAEELVDYGFSVVWEQETRSLYIGMGSGIASAEYTPVHTEESVGTPVMDVLFTDIVTYCNGKKINGYNVGGMTIVYLDDLAAFGNLVWDPITRVIEFTFA